MQVITTIRMTQELKDMIDATAAKCKLTVAEVMHAVAHGIRSGRPVPVVADIQKQKAATKSGSVVVNITGGVLIPETMTAATLRKHIYLRCREELGRPERRKTKSVPPQGVEGVDYNVPDALAAAKMGVEV